MIPTASKKYRQRLDALFSEIERLAENPVSATAAIRCEIEALRTRVQELEAEFLQNEKSVAAQDSERNEPPVAQESSKPENVSEPQQRAGLILYEKERVGYAYSDDTMAPLRDTDPVMINGKNSVAVPLMAGGQAVGEMRIAPPPEHTLTSEEISLTNAVAQQVSLQVQNLRLLEAAERARRDAESATRQFVHEGWDSYLDAIHQKERIGFAYDQASVAPYTEKLHTDGGVQESVTVMDEQVGRLYLQPDPARPLTNMDKALISGVANQVAQQIESIRLLADAARARADAEQATRRLSRESWQAYTQRAQTSLGYFYDSIQVAPLTESSNLKNINFAQPLTVRGEAIGQLAMMNIDHITPEAAELAAQIAERVSAQLERLRLTEEIQKRAAELATVATLSTAASNVLDPDQLLQSVVDLAKERFGLYHAHVYLVDEKGQTLLLAAGAGDVGRKMVADNWNIPLDHQSSIVADAARSRKSVIANDVYHDKDSSFLSNRLLPDTRSEMAVPMIVGEKLMGVFDVQSDVVGRFTQEDANIYTTLAAQVAVALQNARLYVEQAATVTQLRELDRLKSAFLANMSHELRTPLNSILGFSDVILEELDGPITELMDNDLRLIQKNGRHLLHLINDVLDMAKIDAGRMNLNPEKFNLHDLFDEVLSITSSLALEKSLALVIEADSNRDVEIYADRTRIQQVMINLVNNAIKFTEKGEITIHADRPQNSHVIISVRDTGLGIPSDHLETIFQEFTQVDTSTTRKVGGTGLGLPISRRLIQLHGGRLWAESTGISGEGSVLHVELPLEAEITELAEKQER